ncbi:phospholipase/carboxylesterase [Microdochium nivale]|nr:phospholipase/carboxylesterase [Microdochium nivale]
MASPSEPASKASGTVSMTTMPVAGLALDIYGLAELGPDVSQVSCLWLHHGRGRRKEDMADIARLMVSGHLNQLHSHNTTTSGSSHDDAKRGLIAVAFDSRNHGTRLADKLANRTWRSGNARHAQDMFSQVTGTVVDTMHLIDVLEGYLWLDGDGDDSDGQKEKTIDQHLVLGVSMGGHCVWQLMFEDPRITAGVVVIGCPDYMRLMTDRATSGHSDKENNDKAPTASAFIGSKAFPRALVRAAERYDPRARLFGTDPIPAPGVAAAGSADQAQRARAVLKATVSGKRIQVLSGGKDDLVPYAAGKPFLDWFKDAVGSGDGGDSYGADTGIVHVEDNVYPEAGHEFSDEMKRDAVRFIVNATTARADGQQQQQQQQQERQQQLHHQRPSQPKI